MREAVVKYIVEEIIPDERPTWLRPGQNMARVVSAPPQQPSYPQQVPQQSTTSDWEQAVLQQAPRQEQQRDEQLEKTFYDIGRGLGQVLMGKAAQEIQKSSGTVSQPPTATVNAGTLLEVLDHHLDATCCQV